MSRKIGAITPLWNQELFLKPHFEMLQELDRHVVMFQPGPLGQYEAQHGIGGSPDRTFELVEKLFPNVEIHHSGGHEEFSESLYDEIAPHVQDMDIVFRLDVDMLLTKRDWKQFLDYIRLTEFDCYRVDFSKHVPNYYVTGRYDLGLYDAKEKDPLAYNPKIPLRSISSGRGTVIDNWGNWRIHHLRGWNKPKSTGEDWQAKHEEWAKQHGGWHTLPKELKQKMKLWQQELKGY